MNELNYLLLIASYLRKANHPLETDQEIAQGIIADLKKIKILVNNTNRDGID